MIYFATCSFFCFFFCLLVCFANIIFQQQKKKLFKFWFNTCFLDEPKLVLRKPELDKAWTDLKHKKYPADLVVELTFEFVPAPPNYSKPYLGIVGTDSSSATSPSSLRTSSMIQQSSPAKRISTSNGNSGSDSSSTASSDSDQENNIPNSVNAASEDNINNSNHAKNNSNNANSNDNNNNANSNNYDYPISPASRDSETSPSSPASAPELENPSPIQTPSSVASAPEPSSE